MKKRIILAVVLTAMFLYGTFVFAGVNLHEGLWEITTTLEIPGMPMKIPPQIHTKCLTEKDMVKDMVPKKEDQDKNCKITDTNIKGDTVTWTVKCQGEDAAEITGKTTYSGDTLEGTITIISDDPNVGKIINHITGKRIGDCKQ